MLNFRNLFHLIQKIWILNQFIHIHHIRPKPLGIVKLSPYPSSGRALFQFDPTKPTHPKPIHQESYFSKFSLVEPSWQPRLVIDWPSSAKVLNCLEFDMKDNLENYNIELYERFSYPIVILSCYFIISFFMIWNKL